MSITSHSKMLESLNRPTEMPGMSLSVCICLNWRVRMAAAPAMLVDVEGWAIMRSACTRREISPARSVCGDPDIGSWKRFGHLRGRSVLGVVPRAAMSRVLVGLRGWSRRPRTGCEKRGLQYTEDRVLEMWRWLPLESTREALEVGSNNGCECLGGVVRSERRIRAETGIPQLEI